MSLDLPFDARRVRGGDVSRVGRVESVTLFS